MEKKTEIQEKMKTSTNKPENYTVSFLTKPNSKEKLKMTLEKKQTN